MKKPLRRLLIGVALILVLAIVELGAIVFIDSYLVEIDDARISERVRTADAAADGIAAWLTVGKAQAEAIAGVLEPWSGAATQTAAARSTLDRMAQSVSIFDDGAIVVDARSRVVATTTPKAPLIQLSRESPHATSALRGTTSVSGIIEDPLEHIPVVAFAAPLHDSSDKVTGAVIATSRVSGPVSALIKHYQADPALSSEAPGVRILLVASDGTALAPDTPEPMQRDLIDARAPAQQARADSNPGFFEYKGESGVEKVAGYARASDDWVVVVPQDAAEFFEFGTGFLGRLREATPTRAAAFMIGLLLTAAAAVIAALLHRLRRAHAQAEAAKRAFLAITGHELRTPLTSIRGFSQMLNSRWDNIPDADRKELVQTISRQARNLEHLVERLIVGGQLEAGMSPAPNIRTIDAAEAIDGAADQYRAMSKLHTIEVDVSRPLMTLADAKMMHEVIGHLLENALKYSPAGGGVWVRGRANAGRVEIGVEDEGVGLPSDISGIFDKFGQGEAVDTRTHDEGGVGLGLFIVRTLVEQMRGSVRAERREPAGARFVVTFRAAK